MHSPQAPRFSLSTKDSALPEPSPTSCTACSEKDAFESLDFSSELNEVSPQNFQAGKHYRVVTAPESTKDPSLRRLIALGLVEGTRFQVLQNGNPMILSFRGCKIGIDTRVLTEYRFSNLEPRQAD